MENINPKIEEAVRRYEEHFKEKAPSMEALMSMPCIFVSYIKRLDAAVKNNIPIEWDRNVDYHSKEIDY